MSDHDSKHHDPTHAVRLEEILLQAEEPLAALAASELSGCADCRLELEQHQVLESRLARVAAEEAAALAEARRAGPARGAAEQALEAHLGLSSQPSKGRLLRLAPWLALAAALLIWFNLPEDRQPDFRDLPLDSELVLVPQGVVSSLSEFRWNLPLPPGAWYEVRVHAEGAAGEPGTLLAESGALSEQRWSPEPATVPSWPTRIIWILELRRGPLETQLLERYVSSAQLSP